MIYLFDDNAEGQMSKNYQADIAEELKNRTSYVTHFQEIPQKTIDSIIDDAALICIHNSFPTSDFTSNIIALSEAKFIPLVVFSGGVEFTITRWDRSKPNVLKVKKDRFYFYFLNFIDNLREQNFENIELIKLVIGNNYETERVLIIQDRLSKFLIENIDSFNYQLDFFISDNRTEKAIKATQNYKDLYELFYFKYKNKNDAEDKFSEFEDRLGEHPKARELYNEIKNLVKINPF
jgi:hypothetical protein